MNRDSAPLGQIIRRFATILLMSSLIGACSMFAGAPQSSSVTGGPPQVGDFTEFDEDALVRMAERFESAGDYGSAMRMYGQALEKNSSSVPSLLGIARIYSAGGVTDQAESYFRRVLAIEPGNPDAAAGLAGQMIVADRGADAIAFLNNFVQAGQHSARLYNVLGVAHDLVGEHEQAQLAYSQGLDMAPENPDILNNMALSFAIAGSYDTAIALLQEQVNNPSQRSVARQNLALVYALSGDLEAAEGVAATELTPEQLATNRVFYARLSELSPRDRARAVYLRRLPTLEEQQQEHQVASAAEADGTSVNESNQEPAASEEPAMAEATPPRPLTAAERAAAIIRGRQTTDQEEATEPPAGPGFDTPGVDLRQPGESTGEPLAAEPTAEAAKETLTDATEAEMADEDTSPDQTMTPAAIMPEAETETTDQSAAAAGQPPVVTEDSDMAEATSVMTDAPSDMPEATSDLPEATSEMTETAAAESDESAAPIDNAEMAAEGDTGGGESETEGQAGEQRYWIQVGSYRNPDTAAAGWNVLVSEHADILAGLPGYVQHFTDDEGSVYYRLFAEGFPGFTAANELCAEFLGAGIGCFVIDTTGEITPLDSNP